MYASSAEPFEGTTEEAGSDDREGGPVNWPALYAIGALMAAAAGLNLWVGDYRSAASLAAIGAGGGLLLYSRVREGRNESAAGYRWAAYAILLAAFLVNVIELWIAWQAQA
jgi:hypothetical protein